jgi:hypothetical protein
MPSNRRRTFHGKNVWTKPKESPPAKQGAAARYGQLRSAVGQGLLFNERPVRICPEAVNEVARDYAGANGSSSVGIRRATRLIKTLLGCQCCGISGGHYLFDLHHHIKDVGKGAAGHEKAVSISSINSYRLMSEELTKCCVVCANCHRKIHAGVIVQPCPMLRCSAKTLSRLAALTKGLRELPGGGQQKRSRAQARPVKRGAPGIYYSGGP